jgi:pyridoxine 4-dehydrogenase
MSTTPNAAAAGTITIGGDLPIHRLGYGAMRITGPGVIGLPHDLASSRATLRELPTLGVNFVETSIAYGPLISEMLVREALHPYEGITIATNGGLERPGPSQWTSNAKPENLRAHVEGSLKLLGIERIDLWQLHRVDRDIPLDEQFGAIADLQREGLIRHIGLCNTSADEFDAASKHFTVATVQERYHVIDRRKEPALERCEREGIPFIAYFPLATGALAAADSILRPIAQKIGITPGQAALAWLLRRSQVIVPIPGTTNPLHLRENVAAAHIQLTDEQYAEIERVGKRAALLRAPPP